MFDIKTPNRTYYLAADTEEEMKEWVKYICNICSLKGTTDDEIGKPKEPNYYVSIAAYLSKIEINKSYVKLDFVKFKIVVDVINFF